MHVICLPDNMPYPNDFITIGHVSQSPKLIKKNIFYCSWFEAHERLQKLHQQAILEAREVREESVKEMIMSYNKVRINMVGSHPAVYIPVKFFN
jgi:hypothetical protein